MARHKEKTRYGNKVKCLMMQCMRPILKKLVRRTIKKKSPHGRISLGIDAFLAHNKGRIENKLIEIDHNNMYRNILYPPDEETPRTDIHEWDLTLYLFILTDICRISRPQTYYFKQLLGIRNDLCKSRNSAITRDICKDYRKRIKRLRSKFYRHLRDDDLKEKIEKRANEIESGEMSSTEEEEVLKRWTDLEVSKVMIAAEKKSGLDKYVILRKLLSNCCAEVMRALVINTAKRNGHSYDRNGHWSLDIFLRKNKHRIDRRIHTVDKLERPMDILFPRKGKTKLEEWDVTLLCFVLLNACFLNEHMADSIADIRRARNEIAHSSTVLNLTDSEYMEYVERLKGSISVCLNYIDDRGLSDFINDKISDIEFGEVDKNETIRQLQRDREDQEKREKAREVHETIQKELSQIVKKFKDVGMPEHQVELVIKNSSHELEKKLSKCIVENINRVVKSEQRLHSSSEDDIELAHAIENWIEKWKSKGWVITEAIDGSVLLQVRCSTFDDVCHLYNTHKGEGSNIDVSDLQTTLNEAIGVNVKLCLVMYDDEMERFMEKLVSSLLNRRKALTPLKPKGDRIATKVRLYLNRCSPDAFALTEVDLEELDDHLRRIAEVIEKRHDMSSISLQDCEADMEVGVNETPETGECIPTADQMETIGNSSEIKTECLDNAVQMAEMETDEEKYDPYTYNLYRKALEGGTEQDFSIRVNVVGHFGHGKSTLTRRLLESIKGRDILHYKFKRDVSEITPYKDSPGFDPSNITKRNKSVLFAERQTEKSKPKPISERGKCHFHQKLIDSFEKASEYIPKQMSQEERESVGEVTKSSEQFSSDCNDNVFDIWDFGGQSVFYATHQLFHSRKAIYLLVLDLSCGLNDIVPKENTHVNMDARTATLEYYIRFWVNSIHSFVGNKDGTEPKIILVGSHTDKLKGDDKSKTRQVEKYFDDVRALFEGQQWLNHISPKQFAFDTKNDPDDAINDLREEILQTSEQYRNSKIPAKWIPFDRALFNYKQEKITDMATITAVDSASEQPLSTAEHINLFLKNRHDKGTLFYFEEDQISEFVVLDPQYIMDAFRCLITDNILIKNLPGMHESWQKLTTEAILEKKLVDKLWADKTFMTHKETILCFLQKHRIISEAMSFDETNNVTVGLGWYLVPSLLKNQSEVEDMNYFLRGKKQTHIKFVMSFDNSSIVPVIYHRLTAAILGKWSVQSFRERKLLFENMCVVRLDLQHVGITEMNDRYIQLTVLNLCQSCSVNKAVPDAFRRFVETIVASEFQQFQAGKGHSNKPYKRGFSCNIHNSVCSTAVCPFEQLDNLYLPCPDNESHDIDAAVAKGEWFQGDEMPKSIPEETMSDKTLSRLSQAIGQNWELLGLKLALTEVEIDHIIEENTSNTSRIVYSILLRWRDKSLEKASLNALVQVLQKYPDINVDWDEMRNIVEEINAKEQCKWAK